MDALVRSCDGVVDNCMKSDTIPGGDTYGGFVAPKCSNKDRFIVILVMDGYTFRWTLE